MDQRILWIKVDIPLGQSSLKMLDLGSATPRIVSRMSRASCMMESVIKIEHTKLIRFSEAGVISYNTKKVMDGGQLLGVIIGFHLFKQGIVKELFIEQLCKSCRAHVFF